MNWVAGQLVSYEADSERVLRGAEVSGWIFLEALKARLFLQVALTRRCCRLGS